METNKPQLSYTEAMTELQQIIAQMESPNSSIDSLNQMAQRAGELIAICRTRLTATDEQLQKILQQIESQQ